MLHTLGYQDILILLLLEKTGVASNRPDPLGGGYRVAWFARIDLKGVAALRCYAEVAWHEFDKIRKGLANG